MTKFQIPAPKVSKRVHMLVQKTLDTGEKPKQFASKKEKRKYKKAMGYVDLVLDQVAAEKELKELHSAEVSGQAETN